MSQVCAKMCWHFAGFGRLCCLLVKSNMHIDDRVYDLAIFNEVRLVCTRTRTESTTQ